MAITVGSKSLKSDARKTRDAVNRLHDGQGRVLRVAADAFVVGHGVGKNSAVSEQAVTVNGLAVGDRILAVLSPNTVAGIPSSYYRTTVTDINTLNTLTTSGNRAGEIFTVLALTRAAID
jgi:hypothetical protein